MKTTFTLQELGVQINALLNLFDSVQLQDAASGCFLDPTTLQPLGTSRKLYPVDNGGRCAEFVQLADDSMELLISQTITVDGQLCRLLCGSVMRADNEQSKRETASFFRLLNHFRQEMMHDYVTGTYNVRYLEDVFKPFANEKIANGGTACALAVRINEYDQLREKESPAAVDECLNVAAGVLMPVAGTDPERTILLRMNGGLFLLLSLTESASELLEKASQALSQSPCQFHISLSRRSRFSAKFAAADLSEAANLDEMIDLAIQRLV